MAFILTKVIDLNAASLPDAALSLAAKKELYLELLEDWKTEGSFVNISKKFEKLNDDTLRMKFLKKALFDYSGLMIFSRIAAVDFPASILLSFFGMMCGGALLFLELAAALNILDKNEIFNKNASASELQFFKSSMYGIGLFSAGWSLVYALNKHAKDKHFKALSLISQLSDTTLRDKLYKKYKNKKSEPDFKVFIRIEEIALLKNDSERLDAYKRHYVDIYSVNDDHRINDVKLAVFKGVMKKLSITHQIEFFKTLYYEFGSSPVDFLNPDRKEDLEFLKSLLKKDIIFFLQIKDRIESKLNFNEELVDMMDEFLDEFKVQFSEPEQMKIWEMSFDFNFPAFNQKHKKSKNINQLRKSWIEVLKITPGPILPHLMKVDEKHSLKKKDLFWYLRFIQRSGGNWHSHINFLEKELLKKRKSEPQKVFKLVAQYLNIFLLPNKPYLNRLQPMTFAYFQSLGNQSAREKFLERASAFKRKIMFQPTTSAEEISAEPWQMEMIGDLIVNNESYTQPPSAIIEKHQADLSFITPLKPGFEPQNIFVARRIEKIRQENLHNLKLDFLQKKIRQINVMLKEGELIAPTELLKNIVDELEEEYGRSLSGVEQALKNGALAPAVKIFLQQKKDKLKAMQKHLKDRPVASNPDSQKLLWLLFTSAVTQLSKIAMTNDQIEKLLIYLRLYQFPELLQRFRGFSAEKNFYHLDEILVLTEFFNELPESLNSFLKDKNEASTVILKKIPSSPTIPSESLNIFLNNINKLLSLQEFSKEVSFLDKDTGESDQKLTLTLIPGRGLIDEFAGSIGGACYTSLGNILKSWPDMTVLRLVVGSEENARLRGTVLLFEVTSEDIPTLLIRADNPQVGLLQQISVKNYVHQINLFAEEQFKRVLKKRNYKGLYRVVRPVEEGAISNRPQIRALVPELKEKLKLKLDKTFKFNGYDITELCVEVISGQID